MSMNAVSDMSLSEIEFTSLLLAHLHELSTQPL